MARRSQCSSSGDDPLDPNYLPPHYREEYRIAIDALVEEDLQGYYKFLKTADVVDFLSIPEIQYIRSSIKVPQEGSHSEQQSLETDGESSSNTYWPVHSDLDVPALDLGWPQMHHFIGPTEVTSLVSPPEPDMPSIKEQARRLIQNAWQVIAVVMDMFTDVDIFVDLLNAAARNVAVYILLDEQNAHHFINMVNNCKVNLQSIQYLRVRTVTGVTYHCRSGKSFKGQMMDRFLLTDCRAVLSGNYSFMWSFEKLHRSMAHLFLGQLVATFDEEFRILFAHSQPLVMEDVPPPVDHFSRLQQRKYTKEAPLLYRDSRHFQSLDTCHPEDRVRHFYDEPIDVDWRLMALKRQASLHGPSDRYSRFPSQQPYDQNPSRIPMMENTAFKRHSYAEGGGFSYPFLQQQGIPEPKNQGKQFHRGQQAYPEPRTEPEIDNKGYDKFRSQDHHSAGKYSEPGLPQGMQPPDNFDPVLNYLSSTRNVELDQGSEKSVPAANLPFKSAQPRRLSLDQPNACQSSLNPTDQKQFLQESNTDRKDPTVKRGLRNWRITSYLSAYDNPGDEDLAPPQAAEPLKEPLNPTQQTAPGMDVSLPKIPNIREFKVPAIPWASQLPSYKKNTVQEEPTTLTDAPTAVAAETISTPSESSSTAEGEKAEEAEPKQPKTTALGRDGSFRRNYNSAVPRSSRLRSSLIFSSLDQQAFQDTQTAPGQQDEESDTNEAEQNKKPLLSQVLGQRRSVRKPLGWSHYLKSSTFDSSGAELSKSGDGTSKEDDKDSSKKENSKEEEQESLKPTDTEKTESSPSMPQPKPSQPKTDQPVQRSKSFITTPFNVDMNDPDKRFMFFKELAAKRKAAKVAEAEKSKNKAPVKPPTDLKTSTTGKKEQNKPEEDSGKMADASSSVDLSLKNITADDANKTATTVCESVTLSSKASDETKKHGSHDVKGDSSLSESCKEEETSISTNTGKAEVKQKQTATSLHVSTETESTSSKPAEDEQLSKTAEKENSSNHPPTPTKASPATIPSLSQGIDESESPILKPTINASGSLSPTPSETYVPEAEHSDTGLKVTAEESEARSSNVNKADSTDPSSSPSSPKSGLPDIKVTAEESEARSSKDNKADSTDPSSSPSSPMSGLPDIKVTAEESEARSSKDNKADSTDPSSSPSSPKSSLPDISSQDALVQAAPPSALKLTESVTHTPVETECSSPPTDSLGPVLCPSEAPVPAENSEEGHQSEEPEQPISGEKKPEDTEATNKVKKGGRRGSAKSKKTNKQSKQNNCSEPAENTSEEAVSLSPKSKQPKSSQSLYHSSTANVLSSSNLRDDTKLLLEQISANSQSRNEATKESPVTDEEKEDEAGKKAKREKERRMKTLSRGPKSQQERDKLLERIQSMRKERKVYSRFEMAP